MTKKDVVSMFTEMHPDYREEAKKDYCKMFEAWEFFVDGLCKDGQITQKQQATWLAPFQR